MLTLVGKSNFALKQLFASKYEMADKDLSKELNEKENTEESKVEPSEDASKSENYFLNSHTSLVTFVAIIPKKEYAFQQSFFDNHTSDIKDNPPDYI